MGALRKAGVWLGLVEEEDERPYEGAFDDEFADDDDDFVPAARPRSLSRPAPRGPERESRLTEPRGVDSRTSDRDLRRGDRESRNGDRDVRASELRASERESRLAESRAAQARVSADSRVAESRAERERTTTQARADESTHTESSHAESSRAESFRSDRASVRQLARPSSSATSSVSYETQDNLALAPQVRLRERGVVDDDQGRRHQITTLHPTTYNEARAIGEHFRDGHPVIMNLTEMDEPDAKRLVDFAAGLAFGLRGSFERVTNRVFLLSPANIQVTAEDKARIAEGGFFDRG